MRLISQLSEVEFAQQDVSQIPAADEVFRTPWGHMIQIMTILRLKHAFSFPDVQLASALQGDWKGLIIMDRSVYN